MIKEIPLNKGVKLITGANLVNGCTYVSLSFVGGYSSEKMLELSHLSEHIYFGYKKGFKARKKTCLSYKCGKNNK